MSESQAQMVEVRSGGSEHIRMTSDGVGRTVQVRVVDTPSNGYIWSLAHMTGRMVLAEIEDTTDYSQPEDPMDMVFGEARTRVFYFCPRTVGPAVVQFELIRPWLPDEIAKRVILTVVTEAGA